MEKTLLGILLLLLLFWGIFGGTSRRGPDVGAKFRSYLNRKQYERLEAKARAHGIEREFQEQWRIHTDGRPFELQHGIEATLAFRRAKVLSKQGVV